MQATADSAGSMDSRRKADKRILAIFAVFAILSIVMPIALSPLFEGATPALILSRILGGITLSFLLAGFSSYLNYRKRGLMPRRWLLKQFALVSIVVSLITSVAAVILILDNPSGYEMPDITSDPLDQHILLVFVSLFVIPTLVFFLLLLLLMILGFGIVGVMAACERRLTPFILKVIAGSSGKQKLSIVDRAVRWLFDIPEVLDARNLRLDPLPPRTHVRPMDMSWSIGWQLFFGAILAVYVSFNPFLSNRSADDILTIFSILTTSATLIPFLILSWFIYLRIGARIQGQVKDFTLFKGIRARLFQSYIAIGTLFILVRLSISTLDATAFIVGFSSFMATLFAIAVMSTFVYMNNFENALAEDIVSKFVGEDARSPQEPPSSADH